MAKELIVPSKGFRRKSIRLQKVGGLFCGYERIDKREN
jgi:hypothetical protein